MNAVETSQLLALVQAVDGRRVDETVIAVWLDVLGDVDYPVAREAVRMHRRESTAWLTPAHVIANVERIVHADPAPVDALDNPLPRDVEALAARDRLSGERRAVTS